MSEFERSLGKPRLAEKVEVFEPIPISFPEIPGEVLEALEEHVLDNRPTEEQFTNLFLINHSDHSRTYIAEYPNIEEATAPRGTYNYIVLVDTLDGKVIGFGRVHYRNDQDSKKRLATVPYVGYVFTDPHYKRKGFAERRYKLMNFLSKKKFGKSLRSGSETSQEARKLWKKLSEEGHAKKTSKGFKFRE